MSEHHLLKKAYSISKSSFTISKYYITLGLGRNRSQNRFLRFLKGFPRIDSEAENRFLLGIDSRIDSYDSEVAMSESISDWESVLVRLEPRRKLRSFSTSVLICFDSQMTVRFHRQQGPMLQLPWLAVSSYQMADFGQKSTPVAIREGSFTFTFKIWICFYNDSGFRICNNLFPYGVL